MDPYALERNDRSRLPAKLKRWTKVVIREPAVASAAFQNGEVDVIASASRANALSSPGGCTYYVGFNTAAPPFDDPAVRLAFARGLDRDAFVRDVVGTPAHAWPSLIPSTIAQTLGVRESGSRSAREILKDYLHDREILLLLDNFEHLLAAVLLPAELAYLLEHGKKGRDELLRRFDQEGHGHLTRVGRGPVV